MYHLHTTHCSFGRICGCVELWRNLCSLLPDFLIRFLVVSTFGPICGGVDFWSNLWSRQILHNLHATHCSFGRISGCVELWRNLCSLRPEFSVRFLAASTSGPICSGVDFWSNLWSRYILHNLHMTYRSFGRISGCVELWRNVCSPRPEFSL